MKVGKYNRTEEIREKNSESMLGHRAWSKGVKHSKKTRLKMKKNSAKYWKGRKFSVDHLAKLREFRINNPNERFFNTSIELKMKSLLESLGINYIFQYPVSGVACVDFYIPSRNLIIECDGCYWHGCPVHYPTRANTKDFDRTCRLEKLGYNVLRFWEHEINSMSTLKI